MLNRTFAAEYFYFNFTFFRGKVNFAAKELAVPKTGNKGERRALRR